ncbi:MAG TPA: type I glutamate--ammonia ligase [Acidobacteriota bacterium]|nr:type I glutamate--ammonia ligase [Acidobacteriota bacterium]
MKSSEVLKICREESVRFLRLQFTDILGCNKNVEVPEGQFEKALDGQIMFDGSSIEGFSRIEESDMLLSPDPATFRIFPWEQMRRGKVARLICDVSLPDGSVFQGCPRSRLKAVIEQARQEGYVLRSGSEVEFFLFQRNERGEPTTRTHDAGGYFDLTPVDRGEEARRDIVTTLQAMGFEVEAAHHEVAPGQHEIDFRHEEALTAADNIATFRLVVRKVAQDHGLHATFMPKPIREAAGSGLHIHQSLQRDGVNAFFDPSADNGLSPVALSYIAGQLSHARGLCAVTNPLVNSYKRLVRGYEAPTSVAWSERNRSPLIRVPARRGEGTRCEYRCPDPSCNPYLALAALLRVGLQGIEEDLKPPPPVNRNIYRMSVRQRRKHKIEDLPRNLDQALTYLKRDKLVQSALGSHIYKNFMEAKKQEWRLFCEQVHPWEVDTYLGLY